MRLVTWIRHRSSAQRTTFQAIFSAIVFYGGSLLEQKIQNSVNESAPALVITAISILVLLGLAIASLQLVRSAIDSQVREEAKRSKQLATAANLVNLFVADQIRALTSPKWTDMSKNEIRGRFIASPERISLIVKSAYRLFEDSFGHSDRVEDRIDFEVTFMTRSYLDKEITIPAYANRTGQAPLSMTERATNPKRYHQTETAKIYAEQRPEMKIIEDTASLAAEYAELYPGQKKRIRSSVVYPVLAENNTVLGTLVVHCNSPRFFREEERAHWRELLETFARRLALEKARLDFAVVHAPSVMAELSVEAPF